MESVLPLETYLQKLDRLRDALEDIANPPRREDVESLRVEIDGALRSPQMDEESKAALAQNACKLFNNARKAAKCDVGSAPLAMLLSCTVMSAPAGLSMEDIPTLAASFLKSGEALASVGDVANSSLSFKKVLDIFDEAGGERAFAAAFGGGANTADLTDALALIIDAAIGRAKALWALAPAQDGETAREVVELLRGHALPMLAYVPEDRMKVASQCAHWGIECQKRGAHSSAIELLFEATTISEQDAHATASTKSWMLHLALSYVFSVQQDPQNAEQHTERALSCVSVARASDEPEGLLLLVKLRIVQQDHEQTQAVYTKLLQRADTQYEHAAQAAAMVASCKAFRLTQMALVAMYDELSRAFPQQQRAVQIVLFQQLTKASAAASVEVAIATCPEDDGTGGSAAAACAPGDAGAEAVDYACQLRDALVQIHEETGQLVNAELATVQALIQTRGFQLYKASKWKPAVNWFEALAKVTAGEARANALRSCAHCWAKLSEFSAAVHCAEHAVNADRLQPPAGQAGGEAEPEAASADAVATTSSRSAFALFRTLLMARSSIAGVPAEMKQQQYEQQQAKQQQRGGPALPPLESACNAAALAAALKTVLNSRDCNAAILCACAEEAHQNDEADVAASALHSLLALVQADLQSGTMPVSLPSTVKLSTIFRTLLGLKFDAGRCTQALQMLDILAAEPSAPERLFGSAAELQWLAAVTFNEGLRLYKDAKMEEAGDVLDLECRLQQHVLRAMEQEEKEEERHRQPQENTMEEGGASNAASTDDALAKQQTVYAKSLSLTIFCWLSASEKHMQSMARTATGAEGAAAHARARAALEGLSSRAKAKIMSFRALAMQATAQQSDVPQAQLEQLLPEFATLEFKAHCCRCETGGVGISDALQSASSVCGVQPQHLEMMADSALAFRALAAEKKMGAAYNQAAQEALMLCLQHAQRASTVNYVSIARVHRRLIALAPNTDERLQRYKSVLQLIETLQQGEFPDAELHRFYIACWNVGHRFTQNELYLDAERFLSAGMSFADRIASPQLQSSIDQCRAQYSKVLERCTPV